MAGFSDELENRDYDPFGHQQATPVFAIRQSVIFNTNSEEGLQWGTVAGIRESRSYSGSHYRSYEIQGYRDGKINTWMKNEWELTCYNQPVSLSELVESYDVD